MSRAQPSQSIARGILQVNLLLDGASFFREA
jgi:hypothetical protein